MPMMCDENGCEFVPNARQTLALASISEVPSPPQSSDDESALTQSLGIDLGDVSFVDDGECTVGDDAWEKESKQYLLREEPLPPTTSSGCHIMSSSGCWPKKTDASKSSVLNYDGLDDSTMAGRQAFVVYNPFVVNYASKLRSEDTGSEETLKILRHLIYAITVDGEHRASIGFHGGVSAILTCMEHHQTEHKILEKCCHLLGLLCDRNPELQYKVCTSFGVTRILAIMGTLSKSRSSLLREACFALRQVLEISENVSQFLLSRGVSTLIKVMKHFPKHRVIQLHCTTILRQLSEKEAECLGYPEVVEVIVSTMKQYKKLNDIQINGCAALYAIAREGKWQSQASLVSNNVTGLLLSCMKDNMSLSVIQCQCCAALGYMARNHAEARDAMVKGGAVSIVWDAMKYHSTDEDVKQEGGKALRFLSQGPTEVSTPESSLLDESNCIEYECY